MKTLAAASIFAENAKFAALAIWFITVLIIVSGLQRIKEAVAFILMKLYEFFIQRNAIKL